MSNFDSGNPSFSERFIAAIFSGAAAGITYVVCVTFYAGRWDTAQWLAYKDIGQWVVLAGAILGFLGGISLVAWLWGVVWETHNDSLISPFTAVVLLVLVAIGYGFLKH